MIKIVRDKISGLKYIRARRMIGTNSDNYGVYMRSYIGISIFKLTFYVMDEDQFESQFEIVKMINLKKGKIEDVE